MKKVITICITFALVLALIPVAFAEWDLSDLTFDDLIALRAQTQREMMERGEYEEVEVPQGLYEVGPEIPAGKWTIRALDSNWTRIHVGRNVNEAHTELNYPFKASELIYGPASIYYSAGNKTEITVDLSEGDYIHIDYGSAIFVTYTGKPTLGFKK